MLNVRIHMMHLTFAVPNATDPKRHLPSRLSPALAIHQRFRFPPCSPRRHDMQMVFRQEAPGQLAKYHTRPVFFPHGGFPTSRSTFPPPHMAPFLRSLRSRRSRIVFRKKFDSCATPTPAVSPSNLRMANLAQRCTWPRRFRVFLGRGRRM